MTPALEYETAQPKPGWHKRPTMGNCAWWRVKKYKNYSCPPASTRRDSTKACKRVPPLYRIKATPLVSSSSFLPFLFIIVSFLSLCNSNFLLLLNSTQPTTDCRNSAAFASTHRTARILLITHPPGAFLPGIARLPKTLCEGKRKVSLQNHRQASSFLLLFATSKL